MKLVFKKAIVDFGGQRIKYWATDDILCSLWVPDEYKLPGYEYFLLQEKADEHNNRILECVNLFHIQS